MEGILDDKLSLDFIPSKMHTIYVWYIPLTRIVLNNDKALSLLEWLIVKAGSGEHTGFYHVKRAVLYSSRPDGVQLMVDAADYFIMNPRKRGRF